MFSLTLRFLICRGRFSFASFGDVGRGGQCQSLQAFADDDGVGGGVFVEGGRGSYARVMDSQFVENKARYGGAMVVAGQCHPLSSSMIALFREWHVLN